MQSALADRVNELEEALSRIKRLQGLLPICASCKKIRDDAGYWSQLEIYIGDRSEAEFSHSMCPECMKELYPAEYGILQSRDEHPMGDYPSATVRWSRVYRARQMGRNRIILSRLAVGAVPRDKMVFGSPEPHAMWDYGAGVTRRDVSVTSP